MLHPMSGYISFQNATQQLRRNAEEAALRLLLLP